MVAIKNKTIIFHHPGPLFDDGNAGSKVRPKALLEAFQELGYNVFNISGYAKERKSVMEEVISSINAGTKIEFLYSESRSIPTLLTEKNRLPTHPLLDFIFFKKIKNLNIPTGIFYRDVFWRFQKYKTMLPLHGRIITIPLYWYDWYWYKQSFDHLFLPSLGMSSSLPSIWDIHRLSALPPGFTKAQIPVKMKEKRNHLLRMLYVGGVQAPTYDLRPLFSIIKNIDNIHLTVCCRKEEWKMWNSFYNPNYEKVSIVHKSGNDLQPLYQGSDIFVIYRNHDSYWDFAAPVKLYEAIGNGLPIITNADTEVAKTVKQFNIGWEVKSNSDFLNLINKLKKCSSEIAIKRQNILDCQNQHTWIARAQSIEQTLLKIKQ